MVDPPRNAPPPRMSPAYAGKMMDHDEGINAQHGKGGRFHQSFVQSWGLPVFNQRLHQIKALCGVILFIHVTGSGTD